MSALGAAHGVLSFVALNPELCFAMLALDVAVGLSVSDSVFVADKEVLYCSFTLDVKKVLL